MQFPSRTSLLVGASAIALLVGGAQPAWTQDGATATSSGTVSGNTSRDLGSLRDNTIGTSHNDGDGILHVQQNNGTGNAISASAAIAGGLSGGSFNMTTGASVASNSSGNTTVHDGRGNAQTPDRANAIGSSFNDTGDAGAVGFAGVATIQQNNGDNNAMGAATAVYGTAGALGGRIVVPGNPTIIGNVDQNAAATGVSSNQIGADQGALRDNGSRRDNAIGASFLRAAGTFTVQENNGNGNAVSAASSVLGAGSISQFSALDQRVTAFGDTWNQNVVDESVSRRNDIRSSFNGAAGEATVQQNNGDANVLSAASAIAGITGNASFRQVVSATGTVGNFRTIGGDTTITPVSVRDNAETSTNTIISSFLSADGTVTVQQNNGSANVLSAATAVAAAMGNGNIFQSVTKGGTVRFARVVDSSGVSTNTAAGLGNGGSGVFTLQQNTGSANVLSAATAVASVKGATVQAVSGVDVVLQNVVTDVSGSNFNDLNSSFSPYDGVVTVQQNTGNANVISAATAVANSTGIATQTVSKRQTVQSNVIVDRSSSDVNRILNSFVGFQGVATVQQNTGNGNAIDAATAVAVNDSVQVVTDAGSVAGNRVTMPNTTTSPRQNTIVSSFNLGAGTFAVQQNTGNANALSVATAVVAAASESNVTQRVTASGNSFSNTVDERRGMSMTNTISSSFGRASGVIAVQENTGHANDISAATAVATMTSQPPFTGLVNQSALAAGSVIGNRVVDDLVLDKANRIDNAFNSASGVITVQQNNGSGNVIAAATAVQATEPGLNFGADLRSHSARASGTVQSSIVSDTDAPATSGDRINSIDPSFVSARGMATVQQNNGSNNVMVGAATITTERSGATTGADGPVQEQVRGQSVLADGRVRNVSSIETSLVGPPPPFDRSNEVIDRSFTRFSGIAAVQQNNGDHNVMGSAIGVAANANSGEDIDIVSNSSARTTGIVQAARSVDREANRVNRIDTSFGGATGILTAQQNNGSGNVIGAAVAVSASEGTNLQGLDVQGGVTNASSGSAAVTGNTASVSLNSDRVNTISGGSFNAARGIVTATQNNGDNNVMGASTAVASDNPLPGFGTAISTAALTATVSGNTASVQATSSPAFQNTVSGSFNAASGVTTVQQNNGSNNAIISAITVVANF